MIRKVFAVVVILAGCATPVTYDLAVMPRDSGGRYVGTINGRGDGTGTAQVTIEGVTYSGPAVLISTGRTSTVSTLSGINRPTTIATSVSDSGGPGGTIRALLSSPDGRGGLRCEFSGRGNGGTGTCGDDAGRSFDAVFTLRR